MEAKMNNVGNGVTPPTCPFPWWWVIGAGVVGTGLGYAIKAGQDRKKLMITQGKRK
jgi:hypothetical protein